MPQRGEEIRVEELVEIEGGDGVGRSIVINASALLRLDSLERSEVSPIHLFGVP